MSGVTARPGAPRDELEPIVAEHRHLLEERRRAGAGGRVRRHLEARLHDLEARFGQLLDEWAPGEDLHRAWHAHLHEGAPAPAQPTPARPLVFRGAAETGSLVEIRERAGGDYDVAVDGTPVERIAADLDFSGTGSPHEFELDGLDFRETFSASVPAVQALRDFVAELAPEPPWRFASELKADGLIDGDFGLTPRGRRALARVR